MLETGEYSQYDGNECGVDQVDGDGDGDRDDGDEDVDIDGVHRDGDVEKVVTERTHSDDNRNDIDK